MCGETAETTVSKYFATDEKDDYLPLTQSFHHDQNLVALLFQQTGSQRFSKYGMFQKHHLLCCCSLSSCHLPAVLRCFAAVFQASYAPCSPVHWAGITETECGQGTTARGFGVVTAVVRSYFNTSELQRATKRQYSPNERLAIVELFGCVQAISSTPGKTRLSSSELICRLILTLDLGFACRVRRVSCCMQITLDLQLVIHLCNHCSSSRDT